MSVCAKFQLSSWSRSGWKVWVGGGVVCTVIFVSNPTIVLRIGLGFWQYFAYRRYVSKKKMGMYLHKTGRWEHLVFQIWNIISHLRFPISFHNQGGLNQIITRQMKIPPQKPKNAIKTPKSSKIPPYFPSPWNTSTTSDGVKFLGHLMRSFISLPPQKHLSVHQMCPPLPN